MLLLAAALALAVAALIGLLSNGKDQAGIPLTVTKLTPTPPTSPLPIPSCETIISSDEVQLAMALPVSLTLGGESFPVAVTEAGEEGWSYPSDSSGSAAWVCGTVVNYVVGLEPIPENGTLLASLRPGDEIKLHLSSGTLLFFRFDERREAVPASEASVFEQFRPRLTLVLEAEDGTWQVATAEYVAESEPARPPSPETLAQPGQPVHVGDTQVTVIKGHAQQGGSDLPPGTMVYLVEFSVENVGATSLDTATFDMQLQDGAGNGYLLSPAASALGENGPLAAQVGPGSIAQGTAGYIVPQTLAGPTLIWTFSPWPGSDLRAGVGIPYAGGKPPSAGRAEVSVTDAFLDGASLVIEGTVRNTGEGPLAVDMDDIELTSSAGISNLRVAAPPLPWTIQPGQTQVIELQYEKPSASAALLTLMGHTFEIGGLR